MDPNAANQSYTFGGCGLKQASMTVRFVMWYRNRSYTRERSKLSDHSKNSLQQDPIYIIFIN
jgi:hypothetical protein